MYVWQFMRMITVQAQILIESENDGDKSHEVIESSHVMNSDGFGRPEKLILLKRSDPFHLPSAPTQFTAQVKLTIIC